MMSGIENWVLAYGLNAAWQAVVVFGAAWAVARAVRGMGPQAEHRVWVAALVVEVVLPVVSLPSLLSLLGKAVVGGPGLVIVTTGAGTVHGASTASGGVSAVLLGTCVAGVMAMAIRLLVVLLRTQRMARTAELIVLQADKAEVWDTVCAEAGVMAEVRVSTAVAGPVTVGVARKFLLLPQGFAESSSAEEFRAAAAHECAHMQRGDFAKNLLYEVLRLPLVWHPAVWLTRSKVTESREMVCDAMAAEAMVSGREYARALLRLASGMVGRQVRRDLMAIGIFDAGDLERRIMRVSEGRVELRGVRRAVTVAACVAAGLGTCAGAAALRVSVAVPAAQASVPEAKALHVEAGVMAGMAQGKVQPVYPPEAKERKVSGAVILHAIIAKDGSIASLSVVSGPDLLVPSAMEAVKQWKYKPFLLNGEPTAVDTTITVNYTLG